MEKIANIIYRVEQDIERKWKCIMVVGSILGTLVVMCMNLHMIGPSMYDEYLLVRVAYSISQGEWLGAYDSLIMVKNPSFQIFLALTSKLGLPYLMALGMLRSGAAVYFANTLKKILDSKIIVLLGYVVLQFSPVLFTETGTKLYRTSLVVPMVVILFCSLISMYIHRYDKKLLKYSIFSGLALAFFWYIREDSIWVAPFTAGALLCVAACLVKAFWKKKDKKSLQYMVKRLVITMLPVLCLVLATNALCLVNYVKYGVYATNDFKGTYFSDATASMQSVNQEEIPYVTVNRETIEKLYEVSPTFASIRTEMDAMYESGWQSWGTEEGVDDGEIEGGYIFWALREAVSNSGYYADAATANAFYKAMYEEIEAAFESGELQKSDEIGFVWGGNLELDKILEKTIESIRWIITYDKVTVGVRTSTSGGDTLVLAEVMSHTTMVLEEDKMAEVVGWAFATNSEETIKVEVEIEGQGVYTVEYQESPDVYAKYGEQYSNADMARFDFSEVLSNRESEVYVYVYLDDALVETYNLAENSEGIFTDDYYIWFDTLEISLGVDTYGELKNEQMWIPSIITAIYRALGGVVCGLAMLSMLYIVVQSFRKNEKCSVYVLVLLGLFASFVVINLGVGYAYAEAWNSDTRYTYLLGAYPVLEMFNIMSIGIAVDTLRVKWRA